MFDSIRQLYRYRWLILQLVLNNLRLRYRGSALGVLWTFLNPLLFVGIYTLVFSIILKGGSRNYPLFLLCGFVPFSFFSGALSQGTTAILDGRSYVGKTLFPTAALVVVPVLTNAVNFVFTMPLVVVLALILKVHLGWSLLMLPVIFLIQLLFTQAIVTLFATLNVFYRDVNELLTYLLSAVLFLTPILYRASTVPKNFMPLVTYNPFASMIESYQHILYYGTMPSMRQVAFAFGATVVLFLIANAAFERYRESFAQYL